MELGFEIVLSDHRAHPSPTPLFWLSPCNQRLFGQWRQTLGDPGQRARLMRRGLKIWVEGRGSAVCMRPRVASPHTQGAWGGWRRAGWDHRWRKECGRSAQLLQLFFFFFNGRSFIHHKLHHFKVNPSMIFSIFNKLRTHHQYLIPKNFHHPKKIPCTH